MLRFYLPFAIFLSSNFFTNAQDITLPREIGEYCVSPRSLPGNCIMIQDCQIMVDILKLPGPLPPKTINFLKSSQCGFRDKYPMVCCEPEDQNPRILITTTEPTKIAIPRQKGNVKITYLGTGHWHPDLQIRLKAAAKPVEEVDSRISSRGHQCTSPRHRIGNCISILDCKPLLDMLKEPQPLPADRISFLRKSQCGIVGQYPKVCCERHGMTHVMESTFNSTVPVQIIESFEYPDVTKHPNLNLINEYTCGPVPERKILGGEGTGLFDYPWMAVIGFKIGGSTDFRCGGSIINKRYILTAAHCVTALPPGWKVTSVRVGDHDLSTERDCERDENGLELVCANAYQDFEIESIHYHPEYSKVKFQNDIALIRLKSDIDFTPYNARPVCLPVGSVSKLTRDKVLVMGWGTTETGRRSPDLQQVFLNLVSNEECSQAYKFASIWYKQMCAGGSSKVDSCKGDSGGPLLTHASFMNTVRYIQYGIVSFGPKFCGIKGVPGVYTTVAYYMDWILNTIKK